MAAMHGSMLCSCLQLSIGAAPVHEVGPQWKLVWSDEFNGVDGSQPDLAKWDFDTGGNGWGNKELESYTSRLENVQQRGGNLVITAIRERYTGLDGVTRRYTSARLTTKGQFAQSLWKIRSPDEASVGQGHLACLLDAGSK